MDTASIYAPIQEDMLKVEERLRTINQADVPWMAELLNHILKAGGKRIRPALTLLSAKFYTYNLELLVPMAAAVELFHIATLVHDDTVDSSLVRRGQPTINSIWGDGTAVLVGDYLFANSARLALSTENMRVMQLFAATLMSISRGELSQHVSAYNPKQGREDYYSRIGSKTAALFSMSTESGALLSGAPEEAVQALKSYGHNLGMAFQIVDDILDFVGDEGEMGKPVGSDLRQGMLTLPSILVLERYPEDETIKRMFHSRGDKEHLHRVIDIISNSSIIPDCYHIAASFCSLACQGLQNLEDSPTRRSLLDLADYAMKRKG